MFFDTSRKLKKIIGNAPKQNLEHFYLYNLKINDIAVNLYVSKKRATKATHIHCTESGDIMWEQFYLFGGMPRSSREKKYVLKPVCDKTAITVVVVRGEPGNTIGLERGIFKSILSVVQNNNVYLMLEKDVLAFFAGINYTLRMSSK